MTLLCIIIIINMMKETKSLEEDLYFYGIIFLIIGIPALILFFWLVFPEVAGKGCVFRHVTGMYCPGCGGTRAVIALFQGQIMKSLWYHPLVLYSVILYTGFMLSHTLVRLKVRHVSGWKFHNWYLYAMIAIIAANFVIKNIGVSQKMGWSPL